MPLLDHGSNSFDELLALRPELQDKFRGFLDAVHNNDHVPVRVLELCRARIEQIHGISPGGMDSGELVALEATDLDVFSEAEKAALKVAERIPYQHHQLEESEVAAVKAAFGEPGCVALLTALAFFDVTARLQLTLTSEVT